MKRSYVKYTHTEEKLKEAVLNSTSVLGVLKYLGIRRSGGSQSHISRRIKLLEIDTKHFTQFGRPGNNGGGNRIKPAEKILIIGDESIFREAAYLLRRALLEMGIEQICIECGVSNTYNGKPIRLQIDHINGKRRDNRIENLRFMCPNCHSQTKTFGNKKHQLDSTQHS